LTGRDLNATIDSECAHCARSMQIELTSALAYRVVTVGAEPMISLPLIDLKRLKDPSIIHAF
jgi:hypothetical protein